MSLEKPTEIVEIKKPWQSKTNWAALLMAALSFFPKVHELVSANPELFMQILSGAIIFLRWLTKGKVSIK